MTVSAKMIAVDTLPIYAYGSLPAASSVPVNTIVQASGVKSGVNILLQSNGNYWIPLNGYVVFAQSHVAVSVTGTTDKTTLASVAVPAGFLAVPNSQLVIESHWSYTNNSNTKTTRVEIGASLISSATGASVASNYHNRLLNIRSASSQYSNVSTAVVPGSSASALSSYTENLNNALNIVISVQLANAADTATMQGYQMRFIV